MSIEAMKQALKALEVLLRDYGAVHDAGDLEMQPAFHQAHVAVEKLRQAIEQAEKQEPVAWAEITKDYVAVSDEPFENATPLYAAPVHASDISQERVDETAKDRQEDWYGQWQWRCGYERGWDKAMEKREWVGLDHEQMRNTTLQFNQGAIWAERILKEKNT
jgi:hypothetical protein